MSRGLRVGVVVAVLATYVTLSLGGVVLGNPSELVFILPLTVAFLASPAVGAMIVLRRPDNRIGWLFCVMGLAFGATMFAEGYSYSAIRGGWPGLQQAVWVAQWAFLMFILPGVLLFVLFPSGRMPSRRWLLPVAVAVAAALVTGIGWAFGPAVFETTLIETDTVGMTRWAVPNPFPVPAWLSPAFSTAAEVGNTVLIGSAVFFAVGMVVRLRRARGIERQQLKWFVLATVMIALLIPISAFLPDPLADAVWVLTISAFGAGLPIAAGIAILRYRLYDIDLLINRTLVYGALSLILGVLYVALVLGLQVLVSPLTGNETLSVAISTLAIAALFGPARRRVQATVDRRFYRSRYDARRTVEAFAARLRDEVDLDSLKGELQAATRRTVGPTTASVWLREVTP